MCKPLNLSPLLPSEVQLPASKSISARALIVSALAEGACVLHNLSDCDDTQAVIRALGTSTMTDGATSATATDSAATTIDIGAAGTAMRFLTAYYATREGEECVLTGTERMKHRPIRILVEALRQLGAEISYVGEEGFPPLRIRGQRLKGGAVSIDAGVSSQYISALLMLGSTLAEGLQLRLVGDVASRPYILMTLRLMQQFGAHCDFEDHTIRIAPGGYHRTADFTVEPDWSAASYWYELVALSPDSDARVLLSGLSAESLQGDSICADYFLHFGVATTFTPEGALLCKKASVATSDFAATNDSSAVAPIHLDFSDCPDLAQTFVVTAAVQGVAFCFSGLKSLRIKETDRIAALIAELAKLGIRVYESAPGQLSFDGADASSARSSLAEEPISIRTYEDHRMAMAFAPAAYVFPNLVITHPEVVSKSYPTFWHDLPLL